MNTKRGIAPVAALIIAVLIIGGGSYAVKKGAQKRAEKKNTPAVVQENENNQATGTSSALHVKLNEQNGSGLKGEATLTEIGTSTVKVILTITGKPSNAPQPAHIHLGACPNPGAVKYPLTSVGNGASQTELAGVTLASLIAELPLAINVHKSATEASVYVACGDITIKEKEEATREGVTSGMPVPGSATPEMVVTPEKKVKVNYTVSGFAPKVITVKKGETIMFENKTGKAASIASDPHPTHVTYPEFDQYKTDARGKTEFSFTFEKVGTWQYHDHLNANMTGTVVVTE